MSRILSAVAVDIVTIKMIVAVTAPVDAITAAIVKETAAVGS